MIPSIRTPQVLEGPRGSGLGNPGRNFLLLTDLAKIRPKEGEFVFLSPSTDLRLLLRGAKTVQDREGRVLSETAPLEVKFEGGFLRTNDPVAGELMMNHTQRGKLFFAHEDVSSMKDESDKKQLEAFMSAASEETIARLKQMVTEKSFNLGKKEKSS